MDTPVNRDASVVQETVPSPSFFSRYKKYITIAVILILIPLIIFALKKPQQITQAPSAKPTPTQEALLAHKAKQDMPIFFQSLVKLPYLPSPQNSTDVTPIKDNKGKILDEKIFEINIAMKSGSFVNALLYYRNAAALNKRSITYFTSDIKSNLTSTSAASLVAQYFTVPPKGEWKCGQLTAGDNVSTICESFWEIRNQVKMGVGVVYPMAGEKTSATAHTSVFFCELYKGNISFNDKSCNPYMIKTGVGK